LRQVATTQRARLRGAIEVERVRIAARNLQESVRSAAEQEAWGPFWLRRKRQLTRYDLGALQAGRAVVEQLTRQPGSLLQAIQNM